MPFYPYDIENWKNSFRYAFNVQLQFFVYRVFSRLQNRAQERCIFVCQSQSLPCRLFGKEICMNNKIQLLRDGFGQTTGTLTSPFKKALISYAGYTGTSVAAIGLFYLVLRASCHLVIYLFLGLTVLALLLWIRNLFGVIWGLSLAVLLALPVYFRYDRVVPVNINSEMVLVHMSIFLASVLLPHRQTPHELILYPLLLAVQNLLDIDILLILQEEPLLLQLVI